MAGWAQYPQYGSYQAGNPGQGVHPSPVAYQSVTPNSAQGAYPAQASYPLQGGNFYSTGGYNAQATIAPQQYHDPAYPQQQYGPPQSTWPLFQGYAQQSYPQSMPAQPAYPPHPQYQPVPAPQPQQTFYQQPVPPPSQSSQQQTSKGKVARPSLDTCYNCGSPDHWAMNCPEPKRPIPYGASLESTPSHGPQKGKHKPAIVTRYAVPPHVAAQHGTPNTPLPLQTPMTPQFGAYAMHTWQGNQPPTPYAQNFPSSNQQFGSAQQSYGLPTPRNSFSLVSTPQADSNSPQQWNVPSNHPAQYQSSSQSPYVSGSPINGVARTQEEPPNAHVGQNVADRPRKDSMDQSVSMQSITTDNDGDDDDLQLLDTTDLPKGFESDDFPKPKPVGIPIPALDSAEFEHHSPVPGLSEGRMDQTVSKYHGNGSEAFMHVNISETLSFADRLHDPVYAQIILEEVIPSHKITRTSPSSSSHKVSNSSTLATDTSPAPHTQAEVGGNKTPVYRQEPDSLPRPRDAFDLDADDFVYEETFPSHHAVEATSQLSDLNTFPYPPPPPPPPPPPRSLPGSTVRYSRTDHTSYNGNQASGHFENGQKHRSSSNNSLCSPGQSSARKRKAEATDFMESSERDRKRQDDDHVQKYKRSQPKVAEAYSRRW